MNTYTYTILDKKGNKRKSTIDANSLDEARRLIKLTGKTLISIEEPSLLSKLKVPKKVTPKDLAIFCQQMTSMLRAGVTATDALNMVATSTSNSSLKDGINQCSASVSKGNSLAESMKQFPNVFPFLLVQMMEAGEASGSMDITFERMAIQFEKSQKTKDTIKKATNYPKLVLAICLIAVVIICVVVMPMFVDIFAELGTELPAVTKMLLNLSDFIKNKWYIMLVIIVPTIFGLAWFTKSKKGKAFITSVKMKIPVFKNLEEKTATANMARLLSTLLGSGMYMADALEIVANTTENSFYKEAIESIRKDVMNGYSLYDAVDNTNMFPVLFLNLINIGEQTGDISMMLEKAAVYFEEEVDLAVEKISGALQPVMIVIMGGLVGIMVYAIYGPMMSMYDGIA